MKYNNNLLLFGQWRNNFVQFKIFIWIFNAEIGDWIKKRRLLLFTAEVNFESVIKQLMGIFECIYTNCIQPFFKGHRIIVLILIFYCFTPRFLKQVLGFRCIFAKRNAKPCQITTVSLYVFIKIYFQNSPPFPYLFESFRYIYNWKDKKVQFS